CLRDVAPAGLGRGCRGGAVRAGRAEDVEEGVGGGGAAGRAPDDPLDAGRRVGDLDGGEAGELRGVGGGEQGDAEALGDEAGHERVDRGDLEGDVAVQSCGGEGQVRLVAAGGALGEVDEDFLAEPAQVDG